MSNINRLVFKTHTWFQLTLAADFDTSFFALLFTTDIS